MIKIIKNFSIYKMLFKKQGCILDISNKKTKIYLPNFEKDFIQNMIYKKEEFFEYELLKYAKKSLIKKNAVILDIGANIGNHTLFFAKECQASKVYSFEPIIDAYKILTQNIEINNLKNVELINFAVGAEEGYADIIKKFKDNLGGTQLNTSNRQTSIKIITIDSLNLQKVDFIKIDTEFFEKQVLDGAIQTIERTKPNIWIESTNKYFKEVHSTLCKLGYVKIRSVNADHFYKYSEIK